MGSPFNKILPWLLATVLHAQSFQNFGTDILNLQLLTDEDLAALESLLDNPLDLNTATPADLWFLNDSLSSVVLAVRQFGSFSSWEDVARRTKLSPARIDALRQFVYLQPGRGVQAQLSTRLIAAEDDERIRTRLNLEGDQWQAQWVMQRDPGEYHLTDLSDLSLTIHRDSTRITLGAHRLTWGLGLVLADEFASPRGETLLRPTSQTIRLRPGYSNTNTGVLRGVGIHHHRGRLHLIAGASIQQADITIDPDGTARVVAFRAHIAPAATAGETISYIGATTSLLGWNVGGLTSRYDLQAAAGSQGSRRQVHSLVARRSFQGGLGEWHVSHEQALQPNNGGEARPVREMASQTRLSLIGFRGARNARLRFTLLHRSYPADWIPLRGRLVGDRVSSGNQSGWFFGWLWGRTPWKFSGYLDCYRQLEPQHTGSWPREGWESGVTTSVRRGSLEAFLYYRGREETIGAGAMNPTGLDITQQRITTSHYVRFGMAYTKSPVLTARLMGAVNTSDADGKSGSGETFGGSLRYRFRSKVSLTVGAHGFKTDGWDYRLYVYEDGMPGEFNFRALYGRGVRVHGRIALPVGKGLITLRVARQWRRTSPEETSLQKSLQVGLQMDIAL